MPHSAATSLIAKSEPGISQKLAWWSKMVVTPFRRLSRMVAKAQARVPSRVRLRSIFHHCCSRFSRKLWGLQPVMARPRARPE